MENSHQDGYITEKIFNVFQSGSIPIYDGAPDIEHFIHPCSFLSFDDDDIIDKMRRLKDNEKEYDEMVNQPKINDCVIGDVTAITQNYLDDLISKKPPSLSRTAKKRNKRKRRKMRDNNETKNLI